MNAVETSQLKAKQYMLFWSLMKGGLNDHSIKDFKNEMEVLAMYAVDPALRDAALKASTRYDDMGAAPGGPLTFPGILRASNAQ